MPRTPTEVLKINGSGKHNAGRVAQRKRTPQSNRPLGTAPKYFSEAEAEVWRETIDINPPGVLKSSDRQTVEMLCKLVLKMRTDFAHMTPTEMGRLINLWGVLGMTPADRSRIILQEEQEDKTPFNEFGKQQG